MLKLPTISHDKSQRALPRPGDHPTSPQSGDTTVKAKLPVTWEEEITRTANSEKILLRPQVFDKFSGRQCKAE